MISTISRTHVHTTEVAAATAQHQAKIDHKREKNETNY